MIDLSVMGIIMVFLIAEAILTHRKLDDIENRLDDCIKKLEDKE